LITENFKANHRNHSSFFSRMRKLTFPVVILLILQKSSKSIQLLLNEFCKIAKIPLVTNSAFTQARSHLSHTAFIELNQEAIVKVCYSDDNYKHYKGHRLFAVDGSKVILPNSKEIQQTFGSIEYSNGQDKTIKGTHNYGLMSVMFDPFNRIVIDGQLSKATAYEVDLAIEHLKHCNNNDLIIYDRNYASYRFLATHLNQADFLIRCSKSSFKVARDLFEENVVKSCITTLKVPAESRNQNQSLPQEIKVRFVSVRLNTGELEVLVTSLLDEELYPSKDFKELYYLRWGVEGFYALIKERLGIENFSGQTVEAVKQDFYSTLFITGLESILTADVDQQLTAQSTHNELKQTVNNQVSFNAIKNHVIELFYTDMDTSTILETLTEWFLMNPTYINRDRVVPRKKNSSRVSLSYHRRRKKICF
jgi:hypothetical protein